MYTAFSCKSDSSLKLASHTAWIHHGEASLGMHDLNVTRASSDWKGLDWGVSGVALLHVMLQHRMIKTKKGASPLSFGKQPWLQGTITQIGDVYRWIKTVSVGLLDGPIGPKLVQSLEAKNSCKFVLKNYPQTRLGEKSGLTVQLTFVVPFIWNSIFCERLLGLYPEVLSLSSFSWRVIWLDLK